MTGPDPMGLFYRTLFFYVALVVVTRLMGKRELGRLSPSDFVVTIMIADAATLAIDEKMPLWMGMIPVATIVALELLISVLLLRSPRFRQWLSGTPALVVYHGRLDRRAMARMRYNLDDLMTQLREKNITDIRDVEFAILETGGKLSVLPYPEKRPLTPELVHIRPAEKGLQLPVIRDGAVDHWALERLGKDERWLREQLALRGFSDPAGVLAAFLDEKGELVAFPHD
ncbi:MAG: DUF421 domain-containing protein [Clostridia bacterium]|nr:DUF421 domain-containing protein [Clostridia bacterium]MCL6521794.1 DUF421 domain-containing protein [Bacillota bacterium]